MDNRFLTSYTEIYNVPTKCKSCGGVLVYRGLGEYACEECGARDYDNYGKARTYIEQNPGATAVEVEKNTGVSKDAIKAMLREARFEIVKGTRSFLRCESCNKEIRSGRYCPECEKNIHLTLENKQREETRAKLQGFAMNVNNSGSEKGQRRFIRDKDN